MLKMYFVKDIACKKKKILGKLSKNIDEYSI